MPAATRVSISSGALEAKALARPSRSASTVSALRVLTP